MHYRGKESEKESVQFSCSVMSNSLQPHGLQHTRIPCPSSTPRVCSNSDPSSQWCHLTISSSAVPFSSCFQYFPASGTLPMNQLFTSGGQSIGVSASALVLAMNIQSWFPLGLTGLITLLSKGLSRVFSNTTVQKHQFFSTQLSLWFNWKLHIQKTKNMAPSPITSWQIDGETMETVTDFIFSGSKITADGDCSHEIKIHCYLEEKLWQI